MRLGSAGKNYKAAVATCENGKEKLQMPDNNKQCNKNINRQNNNNNNGRVKIHYFPGRRDREKCLEKEENVAKIFCRCK